MDGGAEKGSLAAAPPSLLSSVQARAHTLALVVIRLNKRRHPLRMTYHYQTIPPPLPPSRRPDIPTSLRLSFSLPTDVRIAHAHTFITHIHLPLLDKKKMGEGRRADGRGRRQRGRIRCGEEGTEEVRKEEAFRQAGKAGTEGKNQQQFLFLNVAADALRLVLVCIQS